MKQEKGGLQRGANLFEAVRQYEGGSLKLHDAQSKRGLICEISSPSQPSFLQIRTKSRQSSKQKPLSM